MESRLTTIRRTVSALWRRERDLAFHNREGLSDFDFVLPARRHVPGVSAMLRVRNEANKIVGCLTSLDGLFDEIVLVDNGSTDDTVNLVRRFKAERDRADRITIYHYPHAIARCGAEHWNTPEDSVHSLVYYYNWCLSKCRCRHFFKWDADMAVARHAATMLRHLLATLPRAKPAIWRFPVQTIYRGLDGVWYLARDEVNEEGRLAPNCAAVHYGKGQHWEQLQADIPLPRRGVETVCIYELKDVAEQEFSHWSTTEFPTARKQREWENFQLVKQGATADPRFEPLGDAPFQTAWPVAPAVTEPTS